MRIRSFGFLAASVVLLAGCASNPPPRAELAQAELAIEQAMTGDANQRAPLEMHEARERLNEARAAYGSENYERARRAAEAATASAQLALAESQSDRAMELVQENRESIEALRQETQREEVQQ